MVEYGKTDIHTDAIHKGERVLIHDPSQLEEPRKQYKMVRKLEVKSFS
jgi:hypothetical protein